MREDYRSVSVMALLGRGQYRRLPNGRFVACCRDCGDLVETGTFNPIAAHGCVPTSDLEEADVEN